MKVLALSVDPVKLRCDFTLWDAALAQTGPLELEFLRQRQVPGKNPIRHRRKQTLRKISALRLAFHRSGIDHLGQNRQAIRSAGWGQRRNYPIENRVRPMIQELPPVLFGAFFTVATAWAIGAILLQRLPAILYRGEARLFAFLIGSACLSGIVFLLCAAKLASPSVFLALGTGCIGYALYSRRTGRTVHSSLHCRRLVALDFCGSLWSVRNLLSHERHGAREEPGWNDLSSRSGRPLQRKRTDFR